MIKHIDNQNLSKHKSFIIISTFLKSLDSIHCKYYFFNCLKLYYSKIIKKYSVEISKKIVN